MTSVIRQAEVAQLSATLTQRENDLLAAVRSIPSTTTTQPPPVSHYYYAVCMYVCMNVCIVEIVKNKIEQ